MLYVLFTHHSFTEGQDERFLQMATCKHEGIVACRSTNIRTKLATRDLEAPDCFSPGAKAGVFEPAR